MIYAIVPFGNPPADFLDKFRQFDPEPYISQSPQIYFARSTGNSRFVANAVGFPDAGGSPGMTGMEIPCSQSYSGFATKDLWDYLSGSK